MGMPRILSRPLFVVPATLAAVLLAVYACEKPVGTAPSTTAVAVVAVTPPSGTVVVGGTMQFAATPEDPNGNPLSGRSVTWASSAPGTASVDGSGMVRGVAVGSATLTATSEGKSGTALVTVASVPVASVAVTPPTVAIPQGQTVQLSATPKDASGNALGGRVITWASGNTAVATVSGSGRVTAVAPGAATITATSEGQSGTASVTVTAPPPPGACLTSSATWQNTAFATQTGSFTAEFDATPNTAAMDGTVGLGAGAAASNADLAVIVRFNPSGQIDARNGGAYAAANAIPYSAGTSYHFRLVVDLATHSYSAYVTPAGGAEATLGSGFAFRTEQSAVTTLADWAEQAGTGTHTVCNFSLGGTTPAPVATVSVSPATANVLIGATVQLTATPKDANGTPLSGRVVTWASDNQAVATVSASGLVTAQAVGTATLTATSEGKSGTAAITVTDVAVASVDVAPATASVPVNGTVQLVATPKDGSGTPLSGRVVTWASSSTTIATVSASGLVTGKAAGSATITATSEGKSGTASITVTPVPVATVTVSPASQTLQTGGAVQLTATPRDASGNPLSGRTITWASANQAVATVSATGLVTAQAVGTATITATSEGKSGTAAITVVAPPPPGSGVVFVGAGDIGDCSRTSDDSTGALIRRLNPDAVFSAGDNAYPDGTATEFATCFDPAWGSFKAKIHPVPGNHEYHQTGALPYFQYFGAAAGDPATGYYSYDLGDWHIIALNGEISAGAGSAQETWLKADLAASTKTCTLAYMHRPRFSAGYHGSNSSMQALWQDLYDAGAELWIAGHNHDYERFAPQTASGVADPARGIREFVVGTGGAGTEAWSTTPPIANEEAWANPVFGVLKLTLRAGGYDWEFIPIAGYTFTDSGSGTCH